MAIVEYIILSDQQLVLLSREGDAAAFEALIGRYRSSLRQLFLTHNLSVDDTDDLLQETYIKLFLRLDSYNPTYTFGQWAYTIARNTFIDYCRGRHSELIARELPDIFPIEPSANPEQRVIIAQNNDQLMMRMAQLPLRYRQLIEMRFLSELSYEEIASQLGIPLGTVSTQIHRARARLLKLMQT